MGLPAAEILAKPFTPRMCGVCNNGKVYTSQEAIYAHWGKSPSCNPKNRPAAPMPLQVHNLIRFREAASPPAGQPASRPIASSWAPEAFVVPAQPANQPATVAGSQPSIEWQMTALNSTLAGLSMLPVQLANIENRLNQQPLVVEQQAKPAAKPSTFTEGLLAWWATLSTPQQIALVLFAGFLAYQISLAWSRSTAPAKAASGGFLGGVATYACKKAVDRVFRV